MSSLWALGRMHTLGPSFCIVGEGCQCSCRVHVLAVSLPFSLGTDLSSLRDTNLLRAGKSKPVTATENTGAGASPRGVVQTAALGARKWETRPGPASPAASSDTPLRPSPPFGSGPGELSLILQEPAWSHVFSRRRAGCSCPGVEKAFHSQPVRAPATRPWTEGLCHLFHPHPGALCSPHVKDEEGGVWRGRLTRLRLNAFIHSRNTRLFNFCLCQVRDVLMAGTDGVPGSLRFTEEGRQSERVKDVQTDGC